MANLPRTICQLANRLAERTKSLDSMFKQFDTNKDNLISFQEFCKGVRSIGIEDSIEDLEMVFAFLDRNKDDFIS